MPQILNLLIPGLAGPGPAPERSLRLSALEQMLGAAERETVSERDLPGGYHQTLAVLMGLGPTELPVAALTLSVEESNSDQAQGGLWYRADPITLHADQDKVYLLQAPPLGIEHEQLSALFSQVASFYQDEGWTFLAGADGRGYLLGPDLPPQALPDPRSLLGADLFHHLPPGSEGAPWRALLNELQMALHSVASDSPANGLWLWGAGRLDQLPSTLPWRHIVGSEPLLEGLRRHYGITEEGQAGATLWLDMSLAEATATRSHAYYAKLAAMEMSHFTPLLTQLQSGEWQTINLHDCTGHRYCIDAKRLRRWWPRKRRPDWLWAA